MESKRRGKREKFDRRQLRLTQSDTERLALIDRVDPTTIGIGLKQWRTVRELLRQVTFSDQGEGSFLRANWLAIRMGVTKRTVQRAARVAQQAELLLVEARHDKRGQASNRMRVRYDALAALTDHTEELPQPSGLPPPGQLSPTQRQLSPTPSEGRRDVTPGVTCRHGGDDVLSPLPDSSSPQSRWSTVDLEERDGENGRDGPAGQPWTDEEIARVRAAAVRIARRIGKIRSRTDKDLLCKAVHLAGRAFSERWLADAVEGVAQTARIRSTPYALLHDLLAKNAYCDRTGERPADWTAGQLAQGKRILHRALARVTVPAELLDGGAARHDLSERFCDPSPVPCPPSPGA